MPDTDRPATRLATRLAFFVAGFGIAAWAPLVPLAKSRLGAGDAALGLLLLCLGIGSVSAMVVTGALAARHGSKPFILAGAAGLVVLLPPLALAATPLALGLLLALFGASLGSIDVAMNVHAVEVERGASRKLMSGFHALYSIGGFAGAALMTALLSHGLPAFPATLLLSALMLAATLVAAPRLLVGETGHEGPLLVRPRGVVLLLSALAAIVFLVEGAMLDWGALLVIARRLLPRAEGGAGYVLFALAMTAGRLVGDRVAARAGDARTLAGGGLVAIAGFALLLLAPPGPAALAGFVPIGLGLANVVPVLFRQAGAQTAMPPALAVASLTTTGYAGILAGPALVGFVSGAVGLPGAFALLGLLLLLVPLAARPLATSSRAGRGPSAVPPHAC